MENKCFEWLTEEICKEYQKRASLLDPDDGQDTGAWRSLRQKLQKRCNIPEVMAFNILRNRYVDQYCHYYGIMSGAIPMLEALKEKKEKDAKKKTKKELIREYKEKIAALENMKHSNRSDFGFEERDVS